MSASASGQWMPIYWSDYFGKTSGLTTEEHGAYLLLIAAYWQRSKPLPDDDKYLAAATRLSQKRWRIMRPKILEYFSLEDGVWKHERVEKELLKSCARIAAASANAYARWHADEMLPTPTKEVSKSSSNGFVVGKKNGAGDGGVTIQDPSERLARFQKWLAERFAGGQGWLIVAAASDPTHKDYPASLALCKAEAKRLGKGWPRQWDTP